MRIARPILALLIALSVAVLPAAGHAGVPLKPSDMADMSEMSAMDDMACCPEKSHPSHKAVDDCASMAGCVLCFGFLRPTPSDVVSPIFAPSTVIAFATDRFDSQPAHPPFRPPRA
jgi:hypothetical protein